MIEKTLYARSSTGAILEWYMERLADKYRTYSGQQGGQIVISEWTTALPKNTGKKNDTTGVEQAIKEVDAQYKKKLKLKYKESMDDIDVKEYVSPMLAKKYKDYADKLDFSKGEWLAQIKFNGTRCIATKDGCFTRKGERYLTVPHIEEALKPFFAENPDAVLDGELYNYDLRQQLNELMKLVRRTVHITPEHLCESEQKVRYYIYDGYLSDATKHVEYAIRKIMIDDLVKESNYFKPVKDYTFNTVDEMLEIYGEQIEDLQEGLMLRRWDAAYENKRSKNLLKMKEVDDAEFEILSIEDGTGNWSGKAKKVWCKYLDGRRFKANFKGSMPEAIEMFQNQDQYIGKIATIYYNGLTGKGEGLPNYAQFDYNNWKKE